MLGQAAGRFRGAHCRSLGSRCGLLPCSLRLRGGAARQRHPARSLSGACRAAAADVAPCGAASSDSNGAADGTVVLTTPLYYVNAAPHMGSAYTTIAVDALARWQRLRGRRVTFVTGTDEHGEKIAAAADAAGVSPQAHCDSVAAQFQALWGQLDISHDAFVRTTQRDHEALAAAFLERVRAAGDIYKGTYEGHYCVGCEKYMDEGEMDAGQRCPTHRTVCELRREENWFFRLSRYQAQIEALLAGNPGFVRPESRRNEVMGWVGAGLKDFSLSRANVAWGIQVPWDASQTVYVWTDALMGYLTAILEGAELSPENLERAGWPAHVHTVGKDIIRFHAVMWPALLLSAGLPPPRAVFGHGFLTKDGLKMGKALGNVLDPGALAAAYGADALRFFLLREIRFGQDGDFSEERFQNTVNASLANSVGNCLNRTLGLLHKFCGGRLPVAAASLPESAVLRQTAAAAGSAAAAAYDGLDFSAALEAALSISGRANQHLEERAPWALLKKGAEEQQAEGRAVLAEVLEALRVAAVLLSPVTPALAAAIHAQLGCPPRALRLADAQWGGLQEGQQTQAPSPVFTRLQQDFVTEPPAKPELAAAASAS